MGYNLLNAGVGYIALGPMGLLAGFWGGGKKKVLKENPRIERRRQNEEDARQRRLLEQEKNTMRMREIEMERSFNEYKKHIEEMLELKLSAMINNRNIEPPKPNEAPQEAKNDEFYNTFTNPKINRTRKKVIDIYNRKSFSMHSPFENLLINQAMK